MWGDPYKDLDDDGQEKRINELSRRGIKPGAMLVLRGPTLAWETPQLSGITGRAVSAGVAVIICVDACTDASTDWLFLLLNNEVFWIPEAAAVVVA